MFSTTMVTSIHYYFSLQPLEAHKKVPQMYQSLSEDFLLIKYSLKTYKFFPIKIEIIFYKILLLNKYLAPDGPRMKFILQNEFERLF